MWPCPSKWQMHEKQVSFSAAFQIDAKKELVWAITKHKHELRQRSRETHKWWLDILKVGGDKFANCMKKKTSQHP